MSIKDIVCKFNYEISKFAKRKSEEIFLVIVNKILKVSYAPSFH